MKPVNPEQKSTTPSVPDLLRKEVLAAVLSISAVALLSAWLDAHLQGPADIAGIPPEHVKAPWIFVGIQQMLRWWPPWLAGVLLPAAALVTLAVIPVLPRHGFSAVIATGVFFVLV